MARPYNQVVRDHRDLGRFVAQVKQSALPFTATIAHGEKRSTRQNSTIHMWYDEIATHLGDVTTNEVRAQCKLMFGVPILRRDNDAFRVGYDTQIKPQPYETKLMWFQLLDPNVTSTMTTKQLAEYMKEMQRHFSEAGIYLTDPEVRKYEGAA